MKKVYISLIACIITNVAIALHVDLDPARKIDFAEKRLAMMSHHRQIKQSQAGSIEKAIATLKKESGTSAQLSFLGARFAQLQEEMTQLEQEITVLENSVKALIMKK